MSRIIDNKFLFQSEVECGSEIAKFIVGFNIAHFTALDNEFFNHACGNFFTIQFTPHFNPAANHVFRLSVTESTFLGQDEDKAMAHGHLTATQAAEIARRAEVGILLLTHFSQRYGLNADFSSEAKIVFPNVIQMRDKLSYVLKRRKHNLCHLK
jgi:hypothetical protein